jgi:hypothetical protein
MINQEPSPHSTPSPMPFPSIDVLSEPVKQAYEASFALTENLVDEDGPIAELAYNTQSILNLLHYALEHPEQENLADNFGQLTLEAMDYFYQRIDFQDGPRTEPSEPPTPLARAIEIGQELSSIEEALRQGKIAYGNVHNPENWTLSFLFEELTRRREKLRAELLGLF